MSDDPKVRLLKPRVHGNIVRDLALRILDGKVRPGETLPTEQALQEQFGISRGALREAMRVLAAKGLVVVRPRIGTSVRPRDEWNRLDADLLEWSMAIAPDLDFVQSLMEARQLIEPAAAEFAARRASAQEVANIEAAYFGMRDSLPHDIAGCCEADLAFHGAIVQASHNAVLRQLVGTIGAALANIFRLTTTTSASHERTLSAHARVLDCIRVRDAAGARGAMEGLLAVAAADLAPVLAARRPDAAPTHPRAHRPRGTATAGARMRAR